MLHCSIHFPFWRIIYSIKYFNTFSIQSWTIWNIFILICFLGLRNREVSPFLFFLYYSIDIIYWIIQMLNFLSSIYWIYFYSSLFYSTFICLFICGFIISSPSLYHFTFKEMKIFFRLPEAIRWPSCWIALDWKKMPDKYLIS